MSIKKMSKEELELMSYNDIANLILKEEEQQSTASLFQKIVDLLELPQSTFENKIGNFYTSLTTDKRFILLDTGNWDLRKNHKVSNLINSDDIDDSDEIEIEDNYDDIIEEDDEEEIYSEDIDDDSNSSVEEYKNLVIVDEEELGLEQ